LDKGDPEVYRLKLVRSSHSSFSSEGGVDKNIKRGEAELTIYAGKGKIQGAVRGFKSWNRRNHK